MARPCRALTRNGSPSPNRAKVHPSASRLSPSTLLATTRVGRPLRRSSWATWASSSVMPTVTSTTRRIDVGLGDGPLGLAADLAVERGPAGQPTAGVDDGELPAGPLGVEELAVAGDAGSLLDDGLPAADDAVDQRALAHVGPARPPADRAGLPVGPGRSVMPPPVRPQGPAQGHTVGGHDLDRAGQVVGVEAVEEPVTGQAHVGQQVAVTVVVRRPGSGPDRRRSCSPATAMLPPKNSLRTVTTRASGRRSARSGPRIRAPYSPVTTATGASAPGAQGDRAGRGAR